MHGRLAEIIVLDQFSRNLHRDSPLAFAQDNMAIALAQEAIKQPEFKNMTVRERHFMLMPLMHSESKVIHEQAVPLFEQFGPEESVDFELKHKVIIDRFGRYPHRNAVLGRESSSEEIEFLTQPGSSFKIWSEKCGRNYSQTRLLVCSPIGAVGKSQRSKKRCFL
ncbi:Uncharacterized protein conserved in bacteria [Rodentibacter pneumotropicus]|uniref:Uncharacterized protein conserved in bacteria n=1 Tax=Rodentibacter pneumotropicus TaxID=758 RepID=A0A448MU50_9PAST|nr:Uncharacterized protein conserved in bacteria [Rodentibacter pneumotropicus]